jgi:hypothetical protein
MYDLKSPLSLHTLPLPLALPLGVCRTNITWLYRILFFPSPS